MKKLQTIIAVIMCASFVGCETLQSIQATLGSPQQVQAEITILGGLAKPKISSEAQKRIGQFAGYLLQASELNTTELVAMIPKTGSQNGDALIGAAVAYLNSTLAKYGAKNQTTLAYMKAVANGLLANFGSGVTLQNIRTDKSEVFFTGPTYPTRFVERVPAETGESKEFKEDLARIAANF
jgi:hypothetical protein